MAAITGLSLIALPIAFTVLFSLLGKAFAYPDVLRHEPAGAGSASADRWASAQDRVRGRTTSGTEKLDRALDSERGKKDRLDDLFRKAQEKLKRPDDE